MTNTEKLVAFCNQIAAIPWAMADDKTQYQRLFLEDCWLMSGTDIGSSFIHHINLKSHVGLTAEYIGAFGI